MAPRRRCQACGSVVDWRGVSSSLARVLSRRVRVARQLPRCGRARPLDASVGFERQSLIDGVREWFGRPGGDGLARSADPLEPRGEHGPWECGTAASRNVEFTCPVPADLVSGHP